MTDSNLILTARAIFAARVADRSMVTEAQGRGGLSWIAETSFQFAQYFEAYADAHHRPIADAPAQLVKADPELPPSVADVSCVVQGEEVFTLRLRRSADRAGAILEPHVLPYGGAEKHPEVILCSPVVNMQQPLSDNLITGWLVDMPTGEQRSFGKSWIRAIYCNGWLNVAKFRVGAGQFGEWQEVDPDLMAGFIKTLPAEVKISLSLITEFACMPQDAPLIGGNWLALWPHRHKGRVCFSIFSDAPEPAEGPT